MSRSFERELDQILDTRRQRHLQRNAQQADMQKAIDGASAELQRRQAEFRNKVVPLIQQTVERANQHLGKRPECCQFCDVSGSYAAPHFEGVGACNPIAYELRTAGHMIGEPLLIELTHDGMVEANLAPPPSADPRDQLIRTAFGWRPVPLYVFGPAHASDLLTRYIAAVSVRWPTTLGDPG